MPYKFVDVQGKISSINGLITMNEAECLFTLASKMPENGVGLEIGSHTGMSSVSLGLACVGTKRKIYCVDPWGFEPSFLAWQENIKSLDLYRHVTPIAEWSGNLLSNWGTKLDLAFIDGNHELIDTMKDFMLVFPFVKVGGIIAFHDVGHPSYPDTMKTWEIAKVFLEGTCSSDSIYWGIKKVAN
jgi:predicted O-methyltransferase YrrM